MQGVDYAWWRPSSASDLNGYDFVVRYLSNDPTKNLTLAEAKQLTSWGKYIVCNWESTGQGGGFAQGAADAKTAIAQAVAAGKPDGYPIYFSIDINTASTSEDSYLAGIESVIPVAEIGDYAEAAINQHWAALGVPDGWRTMSTDWPGGADTTNAKIVQTGYALNGNADADYTTTEDPKSFGGWQVGMPALNSTPTPVTPTSEEDEMSQQSISGVAGIQWPQGSKSFLQFGYDGAMPTLRIVLAVTTGPVVAAPSSIGNGIGIYHIDPAVAAQCRGVIVEDTGNTGSTFVVYAG